MTENRDIFSWIMEHFYKIFYPEQWLEFDLAMSKTEIFLLHMVGRRGEMTMGQISAEMRVSMSTATGIVDRLVAKDFLKRERSESDRRIITILLTEKGKKLVEDFSSTVGEMIGSVFALLTDEEKEAIFSVFHKVMAHFTSRSKQEPEEAGKNKLKKIEIE